MQGYAQVRISSRHRDRPAEQGYEQGYAPVLGVRRKRNLLRWHVR
jgi:hypothetical protein